MSVVRSQTLAALDIGSSKICCFIAHLGTDNSINIVGIGHQVSKGVKAGMVVDMQLTEDAVRSAIDSAERMAGEKIKEIFIGFSGGKPSSQTLNVEIPITGKTIGNSEIRKVFHAIKPKVRENYEIIHMLPIGFVVDRKINVRDPRGMFAASLGVKTHIISCMSGPIKNMILSTERAHVSVKNCAVSSYASGLSVLVEDEMRLGATIVDIGEGVTSISVFSNEEIIYSTSIPIGGGHITRDLAKGLGTSISSAERIKTLHGNTIPSSEDDRDIIEVPVIGENEEENYNQFPRSVIIGIIRPRVEEILEFVRDKLESSGSIDLAGRRVVLTGGTSQLQGIRELSAKVLDKQVRLGKPININGLAEATGGPAFSSCAGLLLFSIRKSLPRLEEKHFANFNNENNSKIYKISRWIMQNF